MKNLFPIPRVAVASLAAFLFAAAFSACAATIDWTNTASGGWNSATNWSPNAVPGSNDTAVITIAGVNVSLDGPTTIGAIILGASSPGTVTLSLAGQTLALNGPLTVNPNGSFSLDSGALVGNTNAVLHGIAGWSSGSLGGVLTLAPGSTLNINTPSGSHLINACILTNFGTVNWSADTLNAGGGTVFYNYGLWNAQDDQTLSDYYGGAGTVFNNYGTFRKSGGANTRQTLLPSGVVYNQPGGVLDVQQGLLVLQGGGNFTGGYIATNSTGTTYLSSGDFNLNGTSTGGNVVENAGNLIGTIVINGALTWQSGSWNNTLVTVRSNSVLNINTSSGNHTMGGCLLTNLGTVNWSGDQLLAGNGTVFYNYGFWNALDDQTLANYYGGAGTVFNNYGTFRKSGGGNASQTLLASGVLYNQPSGTLDVEQGLLLLQGGGNFTGGAIAANGTGTTYLSLGNFNLNGTTTGNNVVENAGILVGTNVINGALIWQSGSWNNTVVTVPGNSVLNINTTSGNHTIGGCLLTNLGTVNWSGDPLLAGDGAVFYNYGSWNALDDQTLGNYYGGAGTLFNNYGTFRKLGGTPPSYTLLGNPVTFNNTGVVDVRQGQLVLQGVGNLTGGYITTNTSGVTYLSAGTFNLNGTATGSNVIENAADLVGTNVINGALLWLSGSWNNTVVTVGSNSVLNIGAGGNHLLGGCLLTNFGAVNWSGAALYAGNGAFFYNYGLWNAQDDQPLANYYGGPGTVFNNFGTFRKSGGSAPNYTQIGNPVTFNSTGIVDVRQGELLLAGIGNFTGGSLNTNTTGTTYLYSGSFNINGAATGENVIENAGDLVGTNIIKGALTWLSGSWNNTVVTIGSNSVLNIGAGGNHLLGGCILTNFGTLNWSGATLYAGAGSWFGNYGLWNAQDDQTLSSYYGGGPTFTNTFNNFGIFRKSAGTATTAIANGIDFMNTGELDAQDGNIALQGFYALADATKMRFGLGGSAGNGSISLSGAAAFTGSLSVNFNSAYWPPAGASFNLLNYSAEFGVLFTNTTLPAFITWQTNYNPTFFTLTVAARSTNPAPARLTMTTIDSANLILQWPGDRTGWRIQAQTNSLAVGLATNWGTLAGASLTNQIAMPSDKTHGAVFFRMIYP